MGYRSTQTPQYPMMDDTRQGKLHARSGSTEGVPVAIITDGKDQGAARLDELGRIVTAYSEVTENLQRSHESLRGEVRRLQHELVSADVRLQRSRRLASLGRMATGIAHEIRNPLAAIGLYAGMLVDDLPAESDNHDVARKIATAVHGLDAIVHDVLAFSRDVTPKPVWIPVSRLFDRALDANLPLSQQAPVRICRDNQDSKIRVRVDPDLMHQAMVNLMRNAIEAMPSEDGALTLRARQEGDNVVIMVCDNGPGIADDDVEHIFEPFFTTRSVGTGLGLAIVHRIVDAHDGAICVYNDGGAVFELSLPSLAAQGSYDKPETPASPHNDHDVLAPVSEETPKSLALQGATP